MNCQLDLIKNVKIPVKTDAVLQPSFIIFPPEFSGKLMKLVYSDSSGFTFMDSHQ
jgi:hypothetical protein